MKISEIVLERGSPSTYTDYTDPSVKGPNGEKLVVNRQGQVGYFKQQGRGTSFVAYDPKAQAAKPAATTASEPDPYAIDYGDAMTNMQGAPTAEPVDPEKAAAVQRVLLSFVPGIGTALDVKDAIEAAAKGEYGEAAASSAFALLGLIPIVGAPTARAIAAAKNFAKANPKVVQAMQGKGAATPKPTTTTTPPAAARAEPTVPPATPKPTTTTTPPAAARAEPTVPPAAAASKVEPVSPTAPKPSAPAAKPAPDPVIQKGQAALGVGGVAAGAAMANRGSDAAAAARAVPEPAAATSPGLSTAQKVGVGGVAGAAVGAGVATATDKTRPQAQDQTPASKSVDKAEPATATTQYQIKPGDNLTKISRQFGTTINDIMKLNPQIKDPNLIYAGKTLNLPATVKEHNSEFARIIEITQRLRY